MSNSSNIFEAFEANGSKALKVMKKKAFTPENKKILRTWGITEASKLIGRSVQTIREFEKNGKIKAPPIDPSTNKRKYTLKHINDLRDYFGTRPKKPDNAPPLVIAVANFKGGVAKTTTAVDAAQFFTLKGYRVLFEDADSQGSGSQCLGQPPNEKIDDQNTLLPYLLGEIKDLSSLIQKTYWDGLDLIPANLSLYNAEFEIPIKTIKEKENFQFHTILKTGIESIKNKYDIIIIDCPPSMGIVSINAIYAANALLIPIPPSMLDFSSTIQFFGMVKEVLNKLTDKEFEFVRMVITKYENTDNSKTLVSIIRQLFGDYVAIPMIPASEAIRKSGTEMRSIYEIARYTGSKKTLDRVKDATDELNGEIEDLAKKFWGIK